MIFSDLGFNSAISCIFTACFQKLSVCVCVCVCNVNIIIYKHNMQIFTDDFEKVLQTRQNNGDPWVVASLLKYQHCSP